MPRPSLAIRIGVFALLANAVLGLALTFDLVTLSDRSYGLAIGGIWLLALISLVATVAIVRRRLPRWSQLGLLSWLVGILAYGYVTIWVVVAVTITVPSWTPSDNWFVVQTVATAIGQGMIVGAVMRRGQHPLLGQTWMVIAASVVGLELLLIQRPDIPHVQMLADAGHSAMQAMFAVVLFAIERRLAELDPPEARVIR